MATMQAPESSQATRTDSELDSSGASRVDGGRSRFTAAVRLVLAVWLLWSAGSTVADPSGFAWIRGGDVETRLNLAGLSFAIGLFLLTGFMSRVGGLMLAAMAVWETVAFGFAAIPLVVGGAGLYLMVRGSGAWAMDIYVQAMQDRVRQREARARALAAHRVAGGPTDRAS